ncbi:hypothetical protein [Streptomyces hokutonensis]|uniref:hypothetical protein n=1 Tax=Streptomyces hokutonensis TaxID=1306990 RepID=UPI00367507A8
MVTPPDGDDRDVVEVPGADRALFRERWRALSRRTRVTVAGAACVAALGALLGYVVTNRPPPPPPDPVAVTAVRITEVGRPAGLQQDFPLTLRAEAASRVTYLGMRDGYESLFLSVIPAPGTALLPGRARTLHTRVTVFCHAPFPRRGTALLFVIVRNARGDGRAQVIPTDAQFTCVIRAMRHACAS